MIELFQLPKGKKSISEKDDLIIMCEKYRPILCGTLQIGFAPFHYAIRLVGIPWLQLSMYLLIGFFYTNLAMYIFLEKCCVTKCKQVHVYVCNLQVCWGEM